MGVQQVQTRLPPTSTATGYRGNRLIIARPHVVLSRSPPEPPSKPRGGDPRELSFGGKKGGAHEKMFTTRGALVFRADVCPAARIMQLFPTVKPGYNLCEDQVTSRSLGIENTPIPILPCFYWGQ
ncbi:uncharacterized protein LOC143666124 isoform X2 [Tamandua tetradactyla]|uniref:uncharacterized protein LOC143666124 isoform X2 n=1 Tax=Tamandua tetradactyla TaxID=48850 RepID=UPI00405488B2